MGKEQNLKKYPKGKSGNPAGKKPGTLNFATIAAKLMGSMVELEEADGKKVKMTKRNAMIYRTINDAVKHEDPNVRLRAMVAIWDRLEGRPVMKVEANVEQEVKTEYILPTGQILKI